VRHGISACFKKLDLDPQITDVRLDGLLKAPPEYVHQQTITKGDQKEKVIGLASIMAKVTRDAHMVKLAKRYPEYHFEIHKGYGTKMHRNIIELQGLSLVHRKTFTKNFSRK
jgi:ribonuclease HII